MECVDLKRALRDTTVATISLKPCHVSSVTENKLVVLWLSTIMILSIVWKGVHLDCDSWNNQ
jgi:hypothetical protein